MAVDLNEEERGCLAQLVMNIFADWRLETDEQKNLLGLASSDGMRSLSHFRHGTPLPDEEDIIERARHVLGIQNSLLRVYPLNANMPQFWLYHRNKALKGFPLQIMLEEGLPGMHRVWRHLDCTLNWV
ncbi:MAG: hypothetical protein M0R77_16310 [Gammaproteobacteria bacterium]|nr:hypothetical protein [Gammaproteobacteria bacterium]